jgi:hypothetical protein
VTLETIFWKAASREAAIDRALRVVREGHLERQFVTTLGRWTLTRLLDEWASTGTRSALDGG